MRRVNRILTWFSTHWPTDLAWPPDVPRPPLTDPSSAGADTPHVGAPGEAAAPAPVANLSAWARRHDFDISLVLRVLRDYGAGGPRAGRMPKRRKARRQAGRIIPEDTQQYRIVQQFLRDRDPRFALQARYARLAGGLPETAA